MEGYVRKITRFKANLKRKELLNNFNAIMRSIVVNKKRAMIRETDSGFEIIVGKMQFVDYRDPTTFAYFKKHGYIFGLVANCARDYCKKYDVVPPKKSVPAQHIGNALKHHRGKPVAQTDISHAYWRIAFQMGVLSEKVYEKGLQIPQKWTKLAALSNLSSDKVYIQYHDGKMTTKRVVKVAPETYKVLYGNIRNECYRHMQNIKKLLGSNFLRYNTDAVFYVDTPRNRKLVQGYLDEAGFQYKTTKTRIIKHR